MNKQAQELKDQNKDIHRDNDILKEKYATANANYTSLEIVYDEKLANLNVELSKLNNEQEHLQRKLKRGEEHYQQNIAQLQSIVREKESQLKQLQVEHKQIQEHNSQMEAAFEQEKLQLEYKFDGLAQLKETELLKVQSELQQQIVACAHHIEENSHREEQAQQIISKLEAQLSEKEMQMVDLQMEHTQLQEHSSQMGADFEQEKRQLQQKFEGLVQLKEKEISHLKAELQQHTFTNAQRIEEDIRRETELQSTLIKLGESEKRCEDLQKHFNKLSDEAECTVQQLESEMEEKQAEINELDEMLSSVLDRNEKKRLAGTADQDAKAQEEQKKHESQMAEQKQQYNKMEQKLSLEKAELAQQFETYKEVQQKDLTELQNMLQQKEADLVSCNKDFADLERQKNSEIAQLKYKLTHIGHAFSQSVGSADPVIRDQHKSQTTGNEPAPRTQRVASVVATEGCGNSITKIAAAVAPSNSKSVTSVEVAVPGIIRRRQLVKRPVIQMNFSDFNTDTDDTDQQSDWEPPKKRNVAKPKYMSKISPQDTETMFNKLKQSTI
ncbi:zinc finger protein 853-like [Drosophila innubila]|uniref:zinc finger protein 853-like n=1 Tax=Drosophila innubila TaxID=198719 RepID=UPI00148E23B7|nr:zinc finger protein 853-like [Drosophila innubila]